VTWRGWRGGTHPFRPFANGVDVMEATSVVIRGGSRGGRGWAYAHPQLLKIPFIMVIFFFLPLLCPLLTMIMPFTLMFKLYYVF
jgi:hypothetical protein